MAVRVSVATSPRVMNSVTRAGSTARRFESGFVRVEIELPLAGPDFDELLGHEFEHVVELPDGVDLRALSGQRHGSVTRRRRDGPFELERARAAGLAAAEEATVARLLSDSRSWGAWVCLYCGWTHARAAEPTRLPAPAITALAGAGGLAAVQIGDQLSRLEPSCT